MFETRSGLPTPEQKRFAVESLRSTFDQDKALILEEIRSQPDVLASIYEDVLHQRHEISELLTGAVEHPVIFTGCGTSYFSAKTAAGVWTAVTGGHAVSAQATSLRLFPESSGVPQDSRELFFVIGTSKSGNTAEVIQAFDAIQSTPHMRGLAITCTPESDITKRVPSILIPQADDRIVQTRAFTGMLFTQLMVTAIAARERGEPLLDELARVPETMRRFIDTCETDISYVGGCVPWQSAVVLGNAHLEGIANAGQMVILETARIPATRHANLMDWRHGDKTCSDYSPDEGIPSELVISFVTERAHDTEIKLVQEVAEGNTATLTITEKPAHIQGRDSGIHLTIPLGSHLSDFARLPLYMIAPQLVAVHKAAAEHVTTAVGLRRTVTNV